MKIRRKILILISLPLVALLVTVVPLEIQLSSVEENAKKEAIAKRVVGVAEEIYGVMGQQIMNVSGVSITEKRISAEELNAPKKILKAKIKELNKLVSDDPQMKKVVTRLEVNCLRHAENWANLGEIYKPSNQSFYLSEFLTKAEMVESMKILYDQINNDLNTLTSKYGETAQEFEPDQLRYRADFRDKINLAVLVVILLVLASYVYMSRTTLPRLQILMRNIQKFSKGERSHETLDGKDELADLDAAFREMSEERNRLEDIRQQMRAMVNHDLRSPLTSINICLELLIAKFGPTLNTEVTSQLKRMHLESQRLVRLASTLLDVDKLEEGLLEVKIKEMTSIELVEASVDAVESLAGRKSIKLIQSADPDTLVRCDEDRTIQVLINFLSNAIKFSPEGSTIEVHTSKENDGFIKFSILDQGSGVPPAKVGSLFSKFQQLDQPDAVKKEGSGLGLYICKMLVETQGGRLGYSPREGGGSCFWFELTDADAVEEDV